MDNAEADQLLYSTMVNADKYPMIFCLFRSPLLFLLCFFTLCFSVVIPWFDVCWRWLKLDCRQKVVLECSFRLSPKGAEDSFRRPLDCRLDVVGSVGSNVGLDVVGSGARRFRRPLDSCFHLFPSFLFSIFFSPSLLHRYFDDVLSTCLTSVTITSSNPCHVDLVQPLSNWLVQPLSFRL